MWQHNYLDVKLTCNAILDGVWPNPGWLLIFKKDQPEIEDKAVKDYFHPHCPHTPLELTLWQAATHQRERKKLLILPDSITRRFSLIEGHLIAKKKKHETTFKKR